MLRCERLHEQHRATHVDGEMRIELRGRGLAETAVLAERVIRDQDVDVAEALSRCGDQGSRRLRVAKVGDEVVRLGLRRMSEDLGAVLAQAFHDGEADAGPLSDAGDDRDAALERLSRAGRRDRRFLRR